MIVPWYLPVVIAILLNYGLFTIILKKVVSLSLDYASRTRRFILQFLFAWLYAILFFLLLGDSFFPINSEMIIILGVGFVNGFSGYLYWMMVDISLSKSSLFLFFDDIIAISLCLTILNEVYFLNFGLILGLILSFSSLISFFIHAYYKKNNDSSIGLKFFFYLFAHSIIRGFVLFLMKYLAIQNISIQKFLVVWYGGAVLAAIILFLVINKSINFSGLFSKNNLLMMPIMSMSIIISLGLIYWAYQIIPLTIVQPFFFISQMIIPTLIGLYYFHERKSLDNKEKLFFLLGIIGVLVISFNYPTY